MPEKITIHRKGGESATIDAIDARRTLRDHPEEWATSAWPEKKSEPKPEKKSEPKPEKKYLAKHRGGGSFSVLDASGAEVLEKLTKEDAELFNASDEAEQEAYITAEKAKRASS